MHGEKKKTFMSPPQINKDMKRDWKTMKIPWAFCEKWQT
jgi:hypothetical protein